MKNHWDHAMTDDEKSSCLERICSTYRSFAATTSTDHRLSHLSEGQVALAGMRMLVTIHSLLVESALLHLRGSSAFTPARSWLRSRSCLVGERALPLDLVTTFGPFAMLSGRKEKEIFRDGGRHFIERKFNFE